MVAIAIQTSIVGFPDAFSDAAASVECDTLLTNKDTLPALAVGGIGQLTTRTNNTDGVITMTTGHGLVTGNVVDVYWVESAVHGMRYGCTTVVAGDALTLSAGAGDNLPTNLNAVVVAQQQVVTLNFDGDDMLVLAVVYRNPSDSGAKAHADFHDAAHASIQEIDLVVETASGGLVRGTNVFNFSAGDSNVFTGNLITHVHISHESASAGTLYIYMGYNA